MNNYADKTIYNRFRIFCGVDIFTTFTFRVQGKNIELQRFTLGFLCSRCKGCIPHVFVNVIVTYTRLLALALSLHFTHAAAIILKWNFFSMLEFSL